MAKKETIYRCSNCGNETYAKTGKCHACGEFGTVQEVIISNSAPETAGLKNSGATTPTKKALSIKELNSAPITKTSTGISELDRVLSGGIVEGQVILLAGFPGSGKSTISLTLADQFASKGKKVLYSSGEESEQQIGLRALRMNVTNDNIRITNETNLEVLLGHIVEEKPDLLIVDSLQTLASSEVSGSIGSVSQGKEVSHALTILAKREKISMILINQILKNGDFSGSEAVQHIVDTSLIFESDKDSPLKFLRAIKNRFGDTDEVGVFQHVENGIEGVSDPSDIFLETDSDDVTGASCSFISEGIRQIPVEIQALVSRSPLPTPRKQFNGVQFTRGQIVCAILDKFCSTRLMENDVFVSTVSGVKIVDPQADLSIAASILSSSKEKPIPNDYAWVGELSLTGQVRGTFMVERKIKEAERLGFRKIFVPKSSMDKISKKNSKIEVVPVSNIKELLKLIG